MGISIPIAPQLVPVAKDIMEATTNVNSGSVQTGMLSPSKSIKYSAVPRFWQISCIDQVINKMNTAIHMVGIPLT